MARRFASHLEAIEWLKQSVLEEEKLGDELDHRAKIMFVNWKGTEVRRSIRYCQRCKVSWPCLVAQEEAIERGQRRDPTRSTFRLEISLSVGYQRKRALVAGKLESGLTTAVLLVFGTVLVLFVVYQLVAKVLTII